MLSLIYTFDVISHWYLYFFFYLCFK